MIEEYMGFNIKDLIITNNMIVIPSIFTNPS